MRWVRASEWKDKVLASGISFFCLQPQLTGWYHDVLSSRVGSGRRGRSKGDS